MRKYSRFADLFHSYPLNLGDDVGDMGYRGRLIATLDHETLLPLLLLDSLWQLRRTLEVFRRGMGRTNFALEVKVSKDTNQMTKR